MKFPLVRLVAACALAAAPLLVQPIAQAQAQAQTPAPAPAQGQKPPAGQTPKPAPAPAQKPADPKKDEVKKDDPVVAIVNGQKVLRSEVEGLMGSLPAQYRQLPIQMIFPALLEQMIDGKLLASEGRKAGMQNDAEVKKRLAFIEDRLVQEVYLTKEIDKRVTDEMLKTRYDKFIKERKPEDEVKARHILVKEEAEAKAIIEELKKGGDFDKIAKDKSTDKGSGAQGGDLGYFKKDDMVPEFAEAAFKLKKGEVTDAPIKTQFGWHVIRVDDRRLAEPPKFEEMKDELKGEVVREVVAKIVEDVRAKAKIERFNMDGSKIEEKKPEEKKDDKKPDVKKDEKK